VYAVEAGKRTAFLTASIVDVGAGGGPTCWASWMRVLRRCAGWLPGCWPAHELLQLVVVMSAPARPGLPACQRYTERVYPTPHLTAQSSKQETEPPRLHSVSVAARSEPQAD